MLVSFILFNLVHCVVLHILVQQKALQLTYCIITHYILLHVLAHVSHHEREQSTTENTHENPSLPSLECAVNACIFTLLQWFMQNTGTVGTHKNLHATRLILWYYTHLYGLWFILHAANYVTSIQFIYCLILFFALKAEDWVSVDGNSDILSCSFTQSAIYWGSTLHMVLNFIHHFSIWKYNTVSFHPSLNWWKFNRLDYLSYSHILTGC